MEKLTPELEARLAEYGELVIDGILFTSATPADTPTDPTPAPPAAEQATKAKDGV